MKNRIKIIPVWLMILAIAAFAGCGAKKAAEKIVGEWRLVSEEEYITTYIFGENGSLTDSVTLFDKDGNALNLSMSNTVSMRYKVVGEHTLELYGTALGYDGQMKVEEISLKFVDDDTMMLNEDIYVRAQS